MKTNYFLIAFLPLSLSNLVCSDDDLKIGNLTPFQNAIAKSLANNFAATDDATKALWQYKRDLKKNLDNPDFKNEAFGTTQLQSNQQTMIDNTQKRLDENKFTEAFNIFKSKLKEAKALLSIVQEEINNKKDVHWDNVKLIKDKLTEMITSISSKTDIEKKILFDQFQKAGIFKDFGSIQEIKDFIDNQTNPDPVPDQSSQAPDPKDAEIEALKIGAFVFVGALGGLSLIALIKYIANKRANSKLTIDFTKFEQTAIEPLQKTLDSAIKSKDINRINEALDNLASKMREASGKEIYPKDIILTIEKIYPTEVEQGFLNKLRVLNSMEIIKSSPLFETVFGTERAFLMSQGRVLEKEYIKALAEKDIKKLQDIAKQIQSTIGEKYGKIEPNDILKLFYDHDGDFQFVYKSERKGFGEQGIANLERRTPINIETHRVTPAPTPQLPTRALTLLEISSIHQLNPYQVGELGKLSHGSYVKIGEKLYQVQTHLDPSKPKGLVEVVNPSKDLFKVAHELPAAAHTGPHGVIP